MVNVTKSQRLAHQPAAHQSIYVHDKAHHGDSNATPHVRSLARIDHLMGLFAVGAEQATALCCSERRLVLTDVEEIRKSAAH